MASKSVYQTGDLKNNLTKLRHWIRKLKYPKQHQLSLESLNLTGHPSALLSLLHYAFLEYSIEIAKLVNETDSLLSSASDARFMEGVYRVLNRNPFNFRPSISVKQFLTLNAFTEQKIITTCEALQRIIAHNLVTQAKKSRDSLVWKEPAGGGSSSTAESTPWKHVNLERDTTPLHSSSTVPLHTPRTSTTKHLPAPSRATVAPPVPVPPPAVPSTAVSKTASNKAISDSSTPPENQMIVDTLEKLTMTMKNMEAKMESLSSSINKRLELMDIKISCIEEKKKKEERINTTRTTTTNMQHHTTASWPPTN